MKTYERCRNWSVGKWKFGPSGPNFLYFAFFFFDFQVGLSTEKRLVINFWPKTPKPRSGKTFSKNRFARNTLKKHLKIGDLSSLDLVSNEMD